MIGWSDRIVVSRVTQPSDRWREMMHGLESGDDKCMHVINGSENDCGFLLFYYNLGA